MPGCDLITNINAAELRTRKVDVKLAPGLRIGYVMGTGDLVPDAIEGFGRDAAPSFDADEVASADLSHGT